MSKEVYRLRFSAARQSLEFYPLRPVSVEGARMMERVNGLLAGGVRPTTILGLFIRALERGWGPEDIRGLMAWLYAGEMPILYAPPNPEQTGRPFVKKWFESILREGLAWRRGQFRGGVPYFETERERQLRLWVRVCKRLLVPADTVFNVSLPNALVTVGNIVHPIDRVVNPSLVPGSRSNAPAAIFEVEGVLGAAEAWLNLDLLRPSQTRIRFADRSAWLVVYPSSEPGGKVLPLIDYDTGTAVPRFEMLYCRGSVEGLRFTQYMQFRAGKEPVPPAPTEPDIA